MCLHDLLQLFILMENQQSIEIWAMMFPEFSSLILQSGGITFSQGPKGPIRSWGGNHRF